MHTHEQMPIHCTLRNAVDDTITIAAATATTVIPLQQQMNKGYKCAQSNTIQYTIVHSVRIV